VEIESEGEWGHNVQVNLSQERYREREIEKDTQIHAILKGDERIP
jgi:hypothetical protein